MILSKTFAKTENSLYRFNHRLNIELIFKDYLGFCVQLYSMAETPQLPPPPLHLGSYTKAQMVIQDRRHLFATHWLQPKIQIFFDVPGRNLFTLILPIDSDIVAISRPGREQGPARVDFNTNT